MDQKHDSRFDLEVGGQSRRNFLRSSSGLAGLWSGEHRPNILLLISDQQRIDTLGFLGKTPCRTPNLDSIAAEGVSFDRCLTPSPLCAPARASIFTGRYPHQVDMLINDRPLLAEPVLTHLLRDRGYQCIYAGKWHLGQKVLPKWFDRVSGSGGDRAEDYRAWCAENGLPDGWVVSDPELKTSYPPPMSIPKPKAMPLRPSQTYDAWIADRAIESIRTRDRRRPFFLGCGFYAPHPPFKVPEPFFSMYDPSSIAEPANFQPARGEPRSNQTSFFRRVWRDHGTNWENWKKTVAVYWGYVTLLDEQVGRILRVLDQEGIAGDTAVVFVSDHGEMLGQHGLFQKFVPYEESIRVPMLMRAPGMPKQVRSSAPVSLLDLAPTLLSIAGVPKTKAMEGIDLTGVWKHPGDLRGRLLFSQHKPLGEYHGAADWRLVSDNRFKYVWNRGDSDELYDLQQDPGERNNLAASPASQHQRKQLRGRLVEWMRRTADPLLPYV